MPRAGLTPDRVVEEAARIADEAGYDQLTLAAVAEHFGVKLPSLYKHVDGIDGLRGRLSTLAVTELGDTLRRVAVGKAGGDALRALADAYRAYAHDHPGRYAASLRAPDTSESDLVAASEAVLEVVFAVLAEYALARDEVVDATRIVRSALHGFVSLEAAGGFGMPQDVDRTFERLVAGLDRALATWNANPTPPGPPDPTSRHDEELAAAFDQQAADFERAPVQRDARALERLVAFAALPPDAHVLDCGCGPGIVAEAFLAAGYRVTGVDLSGEMVRRARRRCARFEGRYRFEQSSLSAASVGVDFDATISRYVLHHVSHPADFIQRQGERLRPGGILMAVDHTTDPDPARAAWHREIELLRDRTHTRSLTTGTMVDLVAAAGFGNVSCVEEAFELDLDEWFDRGTPSAPKAEVKTRLLSGSARGFEPTRRRDGGVTISCWRALVRGEAPGPR